MSSRAGLRQQENDDNRPSSRNSQQAETQTVEYDVDEGAKRIKIGCREEMWSVAVLADGEHMVGGGEEGKIRKWRVRDGTEVGTPMDAGSSVLDIAVSHNGRWIASGTSNGTATVWNATNGAKKTEFEAHSDRVRAVDISFDGTTIATSSRKTVCVWSLSHGYHWAVRAADRRSGLFATPTRGPKRLLKLEHDIYVAGVRFSPDGRLLATSAGNSVRVYNSQKGDVIFSAPIEVNSFSTSNRSLAWSDGKLFALSRYGDIHCLDASIGATMTLSKRSIPGRSSNGVSCISLARSGTFITASAGSSVSFWSTLTGQQIGSVIQHDHPIRSMALSDMNDLVICGKNSATVTISYVKPSITSLRKTVRGLCDELADSQRATKQRKDSLCALIRLLGAVTHETTPDELGMNHDENAQQYHLRPPDAQSMVNQEEDSFDECIDLLRARDEYSSKRIASLEQTIQGLHVQLERSQTKIASLEYTTQDLRIQLARAQEKADLSIRINCAYEQRLECEFLYSQGRIYDAACSLLKLENTLSDDIRANMSVTEWLQEFAHRCVTALEKVGDEAASNADKQGEAVSAYAAVLSLRFSTAVLTKWATKILVRGPAKEALNAASEFKVPKFIVYRTICGILEEDGRLTEAVECFQQAQGELEEDATHDDRTQWEHDTRVRLAEKLEKLGDIARDAEKHDEAIGHYSTALKLNPTNFNDILLKQSDEVIELDPSSHRGYEGKHRALHGMQHFSEAFEAFKVMLSILDRSSDPALSDLRHEYVDATSAIREAIEETIQDMPRVLIDAVAGDLCDRTRQAAEFEGLPIYDELRSSMTTPSRLDHARIREEVKEFYCYVMLSHKWQHHEPTFQTVENLSVYKLPASPAFSKLKNFCILVRTLGFKWAWSDTCCVNQLDKSVQQESLVAMFRWYRGSSLTVVHLLGVSSKSQVKGSLWRSIWNTRGWTYQEYLASKVVQFYTEDWEPYLGLQMFNHKESPAILSEMEQAMNFGTTELVTLQPGFGRVREKLFLASKRRTTREEDRAYSLFGIFNVALPVVYGEGNQAIGQLLEHILTRSDNVTLLAWTGRSGGQHSYLPADLSVYDQITPPHILPSTVTANMEALVKTLRRSVLSLSQAAAIYEQCHSLPPLSLVAGRLRLPCIAFPLSDIFQREGESDVPIYRGTSPMLGDIEIQTTDELSGQKGLLVHPWISPLVDLDFTCDEPLFDHATRALRLIVRLKQPFGALLLSPVTRAQYRRVATDSLIMVRVREETSLSDLMDGIRTIDIQ